MDGWRMLFPRCAGRGVLVRGWGTLLFVGAHGVASLVVVEMCVHPNRVEIVVPHAAEPQERRAAARCAAVSWSE